MSDAGSARNATRTDAALLAALVAFFLVVELVAVDFGDTHWDEPSNVGQLTYALEQRVPFPHDYQYPGALTMVLGALAAPELIADGPDQAARFVLEKPFRLRARVALILLSALTLLATWRIARAIGAGRAEAIGAAAIVATSWHFGLHARFVATDAMVATTSAVSIAALLIALERRDRRALYAAAALTGIAAGFKYTPIVLVVLVAMGAWRLAEARQRWGLLVRCALITAAAFIATTPGIVLELPVVLRSIAYQNVVYQGGWNGYTVDGPGELLAAWGGWFLFAALARPLPLALAFSLCAVVGFVSFARAPSTRLLLLYLGLVLLPFLRAHAFLSRHFVTMIPIFALAAARGVAVLAARPHGRGVLALGALAVIASGASTAAAAWDSRPSVTGGGAGAQAQIRAYAAAHPDVVFLGSPSIRQATPGLDNVVAPDSPAAARATKALAQPKELFVRQEWPANQPFLIERVFGPQEVDFRYAPTWIGRPRVVMLDIERARAAGAALDFNPQEHRPMQTLPLEMIDRWPRPAPAH